MEYEEEENFLLGTVPKFGAIFMSNAATKRECFRRKLLGLPSSHANFVKQVKAGMILFLFEFERRELYGVFRASSDGGLNISSDAFSSSGKQFPAQVRFVSIWQCSPLSEHEFRDAIKENYFSAKKFNFGLSEDQVRRLLLLFSSRKEHTNLPPRQFARRQMTPMRKRGRVDDDSNFSDRIKFEPDVDSNIGLANLTEFPGNPEKTVGVVHDDRSRRRDRVENEHNVYNAPLPGVFTEYPRNPFVKIRTDDADDDGRFLVNDASESERNLNYALGKVTPSDFLGDSSSKAKRTSADGQFLMQNRLENEHHIDNNTWPIVPAEYPGNSLGRGRREAGDDLFPMRDRIGKECNRNHNLGSGSSTKYLGYLQGKERKKFDDRAEYKRNFGNHQHPGNLRGEVRRVADDGRFLVNDRVEYVCHVENGIGLRNLTEPLRGPLREVRRSTVDSRYLMSDRLENELQLEKGVAPGLSFENLKNPLDRVRRETNDGRLLIHDRMKNEFNLDDGSGTVISSGEYSRFHYGTVRGAADDGGFVKSEELQNEKNLENRFRPVVSSEYTALCQPKHSPFIYPNKPKVETDYPLVQDQVGHSSAYARSIEPQNFDFSCPSSHDAMVSRPVLYDPEVPKAHYSHSPSFRVDYNSNLAQDCSPYHGSLRNVASSSKNQSSPYRLDLKGSSICLDIPSRYRDNVRLPTSSNHHNFSDHRSSNPFSCAGYSEKKELEYSERTFAQSTRHEIYGSENMGPLSHAFISNDQSLDHDKGDVSALREKYEHEILLGEGGGASILKDFPLLDNNRYRLQSGAFSSDSQGNSCHDKDSNNQDMEFYQNSEDLHSGNQKSRVSVFSRLTTAPEVCLQENNTDACLDDSGGEASVNEVMNMLKESQTHWVKNIGKSNALVRRHSDDKVSGIKRQTSICSQLNDKHSGIKKQRDGKMSGTKERASICSLLDEKLSAAKKLMDDKISGNKKQTSICSQLEHDQSRTMMKMKMKMKMDVNLPVMEDGCQLAEETRLVDFKRRSDLKKSQDGNERLAKMSGSLHNEDGEGLVDQKCKRRKLIRPVFIKKEAFEGIISSDEAQNLLMTSQENVIRKDIAGSCDYLVNGHKTSNGEPQNVRLVNGVSPTSGEGYNKSIERSSKCGGQISSENCEKPLRCVEGKDGSKVLQNIDKQNAKVPTLYETIHNVIGSLDIEDAMVGETSQELGMTYHHKNAEEAPPSLQEVDPISDYGRGNENAMFQGVVNANEDYLVNCETDMKKKPNRSLGLPDLNLEMAPED